MNNLRDREKAILCGLLLSKYGEDALQEMGFSSFSEAFNVFGAALNTKPGTIRGYRNELDPHFPNGRVGWNRRELRQHCKDVFEKYKKRSLSELVGIIGGYLDPEFGLEPISRDTESEDDGCSAFARRLITGKAAEAHFEANYQSYDAFSGGRIVNTTRFGCGFDFKIDFENRLFFAVEVKGLRENRGSINLTEKEYRRAGELGDRYFLYVVSNFRKTPVTQLWQNPLASSLEWVRTERTLLIPSWSSSV